jgi:hypothetical protein
MWLMMGIAPSGPAFVLAFVLGLSGLAGLYSWQGRQGGRLGLAGFALGITSMVLAIGILWWGFASGRFSYIATERDALRAASPLLFILLIIAALGIGLTLVGIANLREKNQPRWRGLPLVLGMLNIIQSFSMWRAYYVPMSQGQDPWSQLNVGMLWFPSVVSGLLGICWMGLGIMLASEANAQIAPHETSAETR